MYLQRIILTPLAGKGAALTQLVAAQVQARKAKGIDASLTASMGRAGQPLAVGLRFTSLSGVESMRQANREDSQFQVFQEKLAPLLARSAEFELWETLLQPEPTKTPRYVQRVELMPSVGKAGELARLLRERLERSASDGIPRGLAETLIGEMPRQCVTLLFDSLEGFDAMRMRNRADASFQDFQMKLGQLVTAPPAIDLFEVVVPFEMTSIREMAGAARR